MLIQLFLDQWVQQDRLVLILLFLDRQVRPVLLVLPVRQAIPDLLVLPVLSARLVPWVLQDLKVMRDRQGSLVIQVRQVRLGGQV